MDSLTLPEKGIFGVDISPDSRFYYELFWDGKDYSKKELVGREDIEKTLNILSNLPFPQYLLKSLERGRVTAYLDSIGVIDPEALKDGDVKTSGMLVLVPKDSVSFSTIVTRSEDISYLKTGIRYLDLGMKPMEKNEESYKNTRALAENVYVSCSALLPAIFGVEEGTPIFDIFATREGEYHSYVHGPKKVIELKRKPGTNYDRCLKDFLV